jgi:hypothetical protein
MNLVASKEVAAWLGVSLSAVKTLRYRHHRPPKPPWRSFREIEDSSSTPGRPCGEAEASDVLRPAGLQQRHRAGEPLEG